MSKRIHPKTIEDKIHQILCMEQDPEHDEVIMSSKKCYLSLHTNNSNSSHPFTNVKHSLDNVNDQRNSNFSGYPRNKNYKTNVPAFFQQKTIRTYIGGSNM